MMQSTWVSLPGTELGREGQDSEGQTDSKQISEAGIQGVRLASIRKRQLQGAQAVRLRTSGPWGQSSEQEGP